MIKATLDTRAFDRALQRYMRFSKRAPSEIANAKASFIARNATFTTKATTKEKIHAELEGPSRVDPSVALAAILVNSARGKAGKKGLSGVKMTTAIEKMIKKRDKSINYLRSGWIPAIRILAQYIKGKIGAGGPPTNRQVRARGHVLGSAIAAKPNVRCFSEISNKVSGATKSEDKTMVKPLITAGLQEAIAKEVASMQSYCDKKYNAETLKMNR